MDSIAPNVEVLRAVFTVVFRKNGRPFGGPSGRWQGVSDDGQGVQWNAAVDRLTNEVSLGVNLEGMEYQGWPIARFIERELAQPTLPQVAAAHDHAADIQMSFSRDAWQASARLPIQEREIGGTPVRLSAVTAEQWRDALREAYQCLNPDRSHRGRARQWVTLNSGRVQKWVSPHLNFGCVVWKNVPSLTKGEELMRRGRQVLEPIYDFVQRRSV